MRVIGIIGNIPEEAAALYEQYVNAAAKTFAVTAARNEDKAHPPAIVIGLQGGNLDHKAQMAHALGATCILAPKEAQNLSFFTDVDAAVNHSLYASSCGQELVFTLPRTIPVLVAGAIGIIGGNGPYASALYANELAAQGASFIMLSETQGGHDKEPLLRDREILEACGVSKITIPCNGAHVHSELVASEKVIHIVDVTMNAVPTMGPVIVMGSRPSRELYKSHLKDRYIEPEQSVINEGIIPLIYAGKDGNQAGRVKNGVIAVANTMREKIGADTPVILAGTELCCPFSKQELQDYNFISSLHELAKKAASREVMSTKVKIVHQNHPMGGEVQQGKVTV